MKKFTLGRSGKVTSFKRSVLQIAIFALLLTGVASIDQFGLSGKLAAQEASEGCFPGLGAVIQQTRCKKKEILKGFPDGRGNGDNNGNSPVPQQTQPPKPVINTPPRGGLNPVPAPAAPRIAKPVVRQPVVRQKPQRRFSIYNNYDLFGGDYARTKKGRRFSGQDCVSICAKESTCVAFTYNQTHGVCFFKDEIPKYLQAYDSAISGVLAHLRQPPKNGAAVVARPAASSCGAGYKTADNTDLRGNDIGGFSVSFTDCRRKCSDFLGCAGFSWIKQRAAKRCWLKYEAVGARPNSKVLSCVKS